MESAPSIKKILVVDDEKDFLFTMEYWLKSNGYEVKAVTNGKQALEELKIFKPNVILLDINMPEMDGVETLKQIRKMDKDVPVVIITAYIGEERVAETSLYQISGLFYKDKDLQEGHSMLESVLRTHRKLKGE